MAKEAADLNLIGDFLARKRIAMVGVSRDPKSLSAQLFAEFTRRGYDMVPVNPKGGEVCGRTCFATVQQITPPVEAAILMTTPEATERVVHDCAEAGISRVWMFRGTGAGAVSARAVEFCRMHGIQVIAGECPFMFFPDTEFVHKVHGFMRKITGNYPHAAAA